MRVLTVVHKPRSALSQVFGMLRAGLVITCCALGQGVTLRGSSSPFISSLATATSSGTAGDRRLGIIDDGFVIVHHKQPGHVCAHAGDCQVRAASAPPTPPIPSNTRARTTRAHHPRDTTHIPSPCR